VITEPVLIEEVEKTNAVVVKEGQKQGIMGASKRDPYCYGTLWT